MVQYDEMLWSVKTFGSPPVFNSASAAMFDRLIVSDASQRYIFEEDSVPGMIPVGEGSDYVFVNTGIVSRFLAQARETASHQRTGSTSMAATQCTASITQSATTLWILSVMVATTQLTITSTSPNSVTAARTVTPRL